MRFIDSVDDYINDFYRAHLMRRFTCDNEKIILDFYRNSDNRPLAFPQSDEILRVFQSTNDEDIWKAWTDSSSKSALPPDFYNDNLKLMMEVMRFDDQACDNGKFHATKSKENKMLEQLRSFDIEKICPNLKNIFVHGNSELPTNEDHNYKRYRDNFVRTLTKHSKKASKYKENHFGYKLIFFVFDETSGVYFEKKFANEKVKVGTVISAKHHFYWADSVFVEAIRNCNADYLIWFKPYNSFVTPLGINDDLPKILIYDVNNLQVDSILYDSHFMISSEV